MCGACKKGNAKYLEFFLSQHNDILSLFVLVFYTLIFYAIYFFPASSFHNFFENLSYSHSRRHGFILWINIPVAIQFLVCLYGLMQLPLKQNSFYKNVIINSMCSLLCLALQYFCFAHQCYFPPIKLPQSSEAIGIIHDFPAWYSVLIARLHANSVFHSYVNIFFTIVKLQVLICKC